MNRTLARLVLAGVLSVAASACSGISSSPPVVSVASTASRITKAHAAQVVGLNDNFSADKVPGPAVGWNPASGTWSVCQTALYCQTSLGSAQSLNGASTWNDYTLDTLVVDPNLLTGGVGIIGRAASISQYYLLELKANGSVPYWYVLKFDNAKVTTLASGPLNAPDKNPSYNLRFSFSGATLTSSIAFDGGTNFQTLATVTDSTFAAGQIGLRTWGTAAARFTNVLVTLTSALPSESAISSATFVDSIGMNAHFESPTYYNNYPQVGTTIGALGIRHYRVSANQILFPGGGYAAELTSLHAAYGVTFDVLADILTPPASVIHAIELLPPGSVDAVEGPNEADDPGQGRYYDPNFATDVPAYMAALYATVKATPATAGDMVIGPSFANPATSFAAIGNISNDVDAGNTHDYFPGFNPGTPGWGANGYPFAPKLNYGSIAWNVAASAQATGPKPVYATETGYYTAPVHGGVPADIQAKYDPRLYFEQFRDGIPRTFSYQLIGYDTTTANGTLGIVSPSFALSPAYNALAGAISLLSDGGVKGAPVVYSWELTGQTANVHHVLLHKMDGTFVLPLWIEVPSFDPNANGGLGARIAVAPQAVTVNLAQTGGHGVLWTCDPATGTWHSSPVTISNGVVAFSVTDTLSILEVSPS